jgi:hypothetical protein
LTTHLQFYPFHGSILGSIHIWGQWSSYKHGSLDLKQEIKIQIQIMDSEVNSTKPYKPVSPDWRSDDMMIIMQCLVPTGRHRPAAPTQSLKQSKMCLFFWRDDPNKCQKCKKKKKKKKKKERKRKKKVPKMPKRHVPAGGMVSLNIYFSILLAITRNNVKVSGSMV